jgi:hypothetical protein
MGILERCNDDVYKRVTLKCTVVLTVFCIGGELRGEMDIRSCLKLILQFFYMKRSMRIVIHTHEDDYKCEFHLTNEKQI